MTEEMKEKIAVDAFNILINNNLDASPLHGYAKKMDVPVSYVLFLFNKWIRKTEAPCPSKEQLDTYNNLILNRQAMKKGLQAKSMFEKYLASGLSKDALDALAVEYKFSAIHILNMITKYLNGEYKDINLVPTREEILEYNKFYAEKAELARKEAEIKKAKNAKECFDTYLASNLDKNVLASLSEKYKVNEASIIGWIRNYTNDVYKEYGFVPTPSDKEKYSTLTKLERQKNQEIRNEKFRSQRVLLAMDAFNIYLSSDLSLDVLPMLAAKHNVTYDLIRTEIRKYRTGFYASYGYAPSEEEKQRYEYLLANRTPRRKPISVETHAMIGKEGYETLLEHNLDKAYLKPLMERTGLSFDELRHKIYSYRKRVLDPKPSLEQEIKYITLSRHLDGTIMLKLMNASDEEFAKILQTEGRENLLAYLGKIYNINNKLINAEIEKLRTRINAYKINQEAENQEVKTYSLVAQNYIDAMMEYINGPYYAVQSSFRQIPYFKNYSKFPSIEDAIKHMAARDKMIDTLYPIFKNAKAEKVKKFQSLLSKINQNMIKKDQEHKKYDIIDLCLDIDTTIEDFSIMLRYVRTLNIDYKGSLLILENIINGAKIVTAKFASSEYHIASLKYNYNGVELTPELKQKIINYLNGHNIRVISYTIILAFEKYVKGEIALTTEFHM